SVERPEHVLVELERGECQDSRLLQRWVGGDASGRLQPVHLGHADIHDDNVGSLRMGLRERFSAGRGLADDFDVGAGVEQRSEAGPDHWLVLGEYYPDRCHWVSVPRSGSTAGTRQPPCWSGPTSRRPPNAAERSAMPRRPSPGLAVRLLARPSSVISTSSSPSRSRTQTRALLASACRSTLVNASCTIR